MKTLHTRLMLKNDFVNIQTADRISRQTSTIKVVVQKSLIARICCMIRFALLHTCGLEIQTNFTNTLKNGMSI